jgi:pilus assembly protein CpaB
MRRQSVIALTVAILFGLFAVYLANTFLLASGRSRDAGGTTRVAVARVPLEYGVVVTPDKIRFADFPNSSIPKGSFASLAAIMPDGQRRIALTSIAVNEPILASKVTGAGQNASIAALLPDGMRAASVRINDVSGVAGFIQPNDSVDVLITRSMADQSGQQITDVLLQNTRVIAIGQDAKGESGQPQVAKTATLQVDPLGAQKLALAQEIGSLSLVLRKPGDDLESRIAETISLADLRSGVFRAAREQQYLAAPGTRRAAPRPAPRPPPPVPSAPPAPTTSSVEVVRGTQGNNYDVGNYGSQEQAQTDD